MELGQARTNTNEWLRDRVQQIIAGEVERANRDREKAGRRPRPQPKHMGELSQYYLHQRLNIFARLVTLPEHDPQVVVTFGPGSFSPYYRGKRRVGPPRRIGYW